MKRILSLFLSIVLVLTMISGTIIAETSTGSEDVELVKILGVDITGEKLSFKSKSGDSKTKIIQVIGEDGVTKTDTTFTQIQRNDQAVVSIASDGIDPDNDVIRLDRIVDGTISAYQGKFTPGSEDVTSGICYFKGKFKYSGVLSSTEMRFYAQSGFAGSNAYFKKNLGDFGIALSSGEWYDFEYKFDLDAETPTITATYTNSRTSDVKAGTINFVSGTNKATMLSANGIWNEWTLGTNGSYFMYDDLCFIHDDGTTKANITSVGSDGTAVIPHSQNKVLFTLDKELPGLTKVHVLVRNSQGGENKAAEITVTSDATAPSDKQWIVEASLSQDLAAWSEYDIAISKDYYEGYKEVTDTGYVSVTDITFPFSTPSAPLDIRAPQFANDGSATTDIISTIGNTDMTLVYTNTASAGYIKEIKTENISVNGELNGKTISFDNGFASGDTAKLFVIKGWNNPAPLFSKTWAQSYDGTVPEADAVEPSTVASSGEMVLGSFDYTDKEMTVDLNAGSDAGSASGVLYIYKRGTTLKDNLIYADYVTTANDGSLKKTIVFPDDINDTTGEYTVAFYAENVNLSKDFAIYDDDAAFGGTVVKAELDTVGRNYDIYSGELTNWALTKVRRERNATDETAFSLTFPAANAADQNSMRISITPGSGRKLTGRHIVKFKFLADKADSNGYVDFEKGYFTINRDTKSSLTDGSYTIDGVVKANKWYDIEIVFELDVATPKSTINVVDIETGASVLTDSMNIVDYSDGQINGFRNIWAYLTYTASDDGYQMVFKDIQMLEDAGYEKPVIRYVGNNDVVDYDRNVVEFKISENNGLTADNIFVKDSQGNSIKAKSISVTEDMGEYIVTAVMEKNFASWQTYTLEIDAVGYESYREFINGKYVALAPICREFTTPMAPLDIQTPTITSDASTVTYVTNIQNSTGSSVDATTVLTVVDSDGIMRGVTVDSDTLSGNDTKSFTNTNTFALGDTAKYFVIKDFADPVQLFDKSWSINYNGEVPKVSEAKSTSKAGSKAIEFDTFDFNSVYNYDDNKVVVNLNTGAGNYVNGILCVYKTSSGMSASKLPLYIDYVATAADGTLAKEIKFDSAFADTTAQYTAAFYSKDLAYAVENEFDVYNPSDMEQYKREQICKDAKASSTFSGLMQVITGTDSNGNIVNEAWDIFCEDADVTTYDKLKNKENVYIAMSAKLSSVNSFDDLVELFEAKAEECYNKESKPSGGSSSPSSSNKNYGSSSTVISESVSAPDNSDNGNNSSVKSVFTDMNGHWSNKHAEALFEMGIVSGYEDGSFRADNPITRAELTKIIVESLDVPDASGSGFSDVAGGSWYEPYVLRASASGVVTGFEDGTFGPDYYVSRQDAALMIYRAMNLSQTLPTGYKFFADESDIADYASDAIRCLGDLGIITGVGKNTFKPLDNITRGEMAALICRAIDYIDSHLI